MSIDVVVVDPDELLVDVRNVTADPPINIHVDDIAPNVAVDVGVPGPPGPPGGPTVVAVPYGSWPPADPQPDTLYLRLAP